MTWYIHRPDGPLHELDDDALGELREAAEEYVDLLADNLAEIPADDAFHEPATTTLANARRALALLNTLLGWDPLGDHHGRNE